ncbi:sensor histidine kinase [Brachybacterium huguangmaarense]
MPPTPEQPELLEDGRRARLTPRDLLRASLETRAFWPTAPSLLFVLMLVLPPWLEPGVALGTRLAVTALGLVFAAQFSVISGVRGYYSLPVRCCWLLGMWAVIAALTPLVGSEILYMVMFVLIAHAVVLPLRAAVAVTSVIALAAIGLDVLLGMDVFAILLAVAGLVVGLALAFSIHRAALEDRLAEAERRNAVLAVAAERERIGRDLHDILGHSLTTITVSAQLARRLVAADPEAATAQLAEIERISRQSLADVRATASGLQEVRAASEIASARSVLAAAGIEADTPIALPTLPDDRAELFGYVIREAVTNVVRHADARRCTIALDAGSVSIADDGTGIPAGRARTGLAGLARRVESAGGRLDVSAADGGGTVVRAWHPAASIEGDRS